MTLNINDQTNKMELFEQAQILNLCPQDADEAKSLIPR